uniref:Type I restriction enzyme, S subunit n=1 Tax=uncultured Acetothermia bacterium TaxID=236499 RepID=H5SL07_9BACT|nr:type I restriction enzyme, S subunit [uncultured Acetothermia bacterium]
MAVVPRTTKPLDARYLYYALLNTDFNDVTTGSAQPQITIGHLSKKSIFWPDDANERAAIAHILGMLDDKIELNRRMSETLEAMARALFKSWFVDFDPVRAKMEGRWQRGQSHPGLPAHLYDLFPDRLVDSELGEIPEGWEVGTLGDVAEVSSGKRPSSISAEPAASATIPVWGGNGPMGYTTDALYSEPILLTGRVGTLGSVFRIPCQCWPSDNTLVVLPRNKATYEYLYFWMKQIDFDALNRGSTQPLLTQTDLKNQNVLVPADKVLAEFHKHISTCFARLDAATTDSRTLAALRDALLPKLISGELGVKDAERFVEQQTGEEGG